MLRRGTAGRRLWLSAGLAVAGLLFAGGIAFAASETIVAGPAESFSQQTTPYNTDQGVVVQFQDLGGTHNVTARQTGPDGKALFRSATISGGTTGVEGTQYLSTGDYAFFCSVHPTTMNGTLHVTGAGTPLPRPQVNNLKLKTKTIAKAIKKGLRLTMTPNMQIDGVALIAKLGKSTIGKATVSLVAGWNSDLVKLSNAGKAKLRGRDTAKVTVTAEVPFGSPVSAKGKLS
jgi:plastocyanin